MIFHTAAEQNYYNAFFKRWHNSIKSRCPNVKFSLKFVGDVDNTDVLAYTKENDISLILDPKTPEDLINTYGSMEIGRGYYPMARWNSIPAEDDHVCVTDVDVVMVRNDLDEMLELLNDFDLVSISRNKQPKINMMMINYINKDKCQTVSDFATSLMNSKDFKWDIDLEVMSNMKKKMSYTYLHRLVKFDSTAGLVPKLFTDTSFGYYSAVSVRINGFDYKSGYESKKAKYEWADKNDIINFSTKHLFSRQ